jgi:translation initiation factor IF-1
MRDSARKFCTLKHPHVLVQTIITLNCEKITKNHGQFKGLNSLYIKEHETACLSCLHVNVTFFLIKSMNMEPTQAIVKVQKSFTRYIVELNDGQEIEVILPGKIAMRVVKLTVGAKIFVMLYENRSVDGHILTQTDFKLNGWPGWTEEHEP